MNTTGMSPSEIAFEYREFWEMSHDMVCSDHKGNPVNRYGSRWLQHDVKLSDREQFSGNPDMFQQIIEKLVQEVRAETSS